jgi:hypothetical protein
MEEEGEEDCHLIILGGKVGGSVLDIESSMY